MSEEQMPLEQPQEPEGSAGPAEEPQAETASTEQPAEGARTETSAILTELTALGQKLTVALQRAWESEERKRAETEIRDALRIAGERLDEVADDVRKSRVTHDLKAQADKAVTAVEESTITEEVRKGLLTGLRKLNDELTHWLEASKDEPTSSTDQEPAGAPEGQEDVPPPVPPLDLESEEG